MSPYLKAAGSEPAALMLYAWNAELSSALLVDIHYLEVVLRNALHRELESVLTSPGAVFQALESATWFGEKSREDLEKAGQRLETRGREQTEDAVIAELSFGFWRYLLTGKYHRPLWEAGLWRAFKELPNARDRRREVEEAVRAAYEIRNRIAHHEPVYSKSVLTDYDKVIRALGWLSADVRDWVTSRSQVMKLATSTAGWTLK